MEVYLLSAPAGFAQGLSALRRALQKAPEVAGDLVDRAARGTIRPDEVAKIQPYESMFAARQVELNTADVVNVLRCLAFINRGATVHCTTGSAKSLGSALTASTDASEDVVSAVAQAWARTSAEAAAAGAAGGGAGAGEEAGGAAGAGAGSDSSFSVGKLQALDWKLGVRLCSSKCDRLNAPFVRLVSDVLRWRRRSVGSGGASVPGRARPLSGGVAVPTVPPPPCHSPQPHNHLRAGVSTSTCT
jgi:hypothetical protein